MKNSEEYKNIKIPYPQEGVIRTAALDDTVAPSDSVQIAVNMNFDRIGAIQTRKGLTEYADDLDGEIKNFGTLNNSITPDGYARMRQIIDETTFDSAGVDDIKAIQISVSSYLVLWSGVAGDGFGIVVDADLDTGILTPSGTATEWTTSDADNITISRIDSSHFLVVWQGASGDGFAQVMTISGGTITMEGTPLEFDTSDTSYPSVAMVNANHFIVFYQGVSGDGFAEILEVNLGTWAVTEVGTPLEFDVADASYNSCVAVGDGTHIINFWTGPAGDGFVQCFTVNTGTWAITSNGSPLEFDTANGSFNSCAALGDGDHFINFWTGSGDDGFARVFELNLSTFAVTAVGSAALEFDTENAAYNSCVGMGDGEHFVNFWRQAPSTGGDFGYGQIFEVDPLTFDVTAIGNKTPLGTVDGSPSNSAVFGSAYRVLNFWVDPTAPTSGVGAVFELLGDTIFNNYLYAQEADGDVLNWNGSAWVVRRTGVNPEQKARFAQYLNYIWMVNGNASFGDAVQTSNGGAFGTDLVPDDFPPGDFIQAGFEGRVWVADRLADVIYFTDIVQFTPPDTYTLTYDPDINFIKNFSPQDGQTMRGLATTPRALLLFKEDSIYRIYGSTSADAYPAYNVGTYSQESIVTTKDGLFFHHSSGFYKFAYDSQPIEISRRVIDFIQAIPRANYDNVVGIYDGFDAVEWSIGSVTVEGVTYANCVMRYTISTQIWTIYDYPPHVITAFIQYDDGAALNMLMGTSLGKVSKMDDGFTDLGEPIYFEMIDRWRSYTDMYAKCKIINGLNMYTENAAGAIVQFQSQKSPMNSWDYIDTITEENSSLFPNAKTKDFTVSRLRINGNSKGTPVVIHGMEILSLDDEGFDQN